MQLGRESEAAAEQIQLEIFCPPAAAILLGSAISCLVNQGAGGAGALQGQGVMVGQERQRPAAEGCCSAQPQQGRSSLPVMVTHSPHHPNRPIMMRQVHSQGKNVLPLKYHSRLETEKRGPPG